MDIFAELGKLRIKHSEEGMGCLRSIPLVSERCNSDAVGICDCGADKHNETLDGVIEWLKTHHAWIGIDLANQPNVIMMIDMKKFSKIKQRTGCHIGKMPDVCSLDDDQDTTDCHIAEELNTEGKTRTDCQYWKEPKE